MPPLSGLHHPHFSSVPVYAERRRETERTEWRKKDDNKGVEARVRGLGGLFSCRRKRRHTRCGAPRGGQKGEEGGGAHHGAKARKDGGRRRWRIIETPEHDGYDGAPRRSPLPKPASLITAPSPGYSAPLGASRCASRRPGVFLTCISDRGRNRCSVCPLINTQRQETRLGRHCRRPGPP